MAAVYPTAIKKFAYRQDFTQLVNAADVNVAYDEIAALQTTLGTLPGSDNLGDGSSVSFPTVKANISDARKGGQLPTVFARVFNLQVPFNPNNGAAPGLQPNFTDTVWDSHNMWQGGNQLICPRDGIYNFSLYSEWQLQTDPYDFEQPPFDISGYVQIGLQLYGGGRYVTGYNHQVVQGAQYAVRGSASADWAWYKGQTMKLSVHQRAHFNSTPVCIYLQATYLRSTP